ncbi:Hypothetical predicted protein [Xyrichtys novacula]|uniref:Secreted protein n=1 Tax=Xyrichtys novacula TaxID=13765 RepID=A0AAV1H4M3_XYRNO|nr:Hypothetical predicted protein [Xyrichtys novacula]
MQDMILLCSYMFLYLFFPLPSELQPQPPPVCHMHTPTSLHTGLRASGAFFCTCASVTHAKQPHNYTTHPAVFPLCPLCSQHKPGQSVRPSVAWHSTLTRSLDQQHFGYTFSGIVCFCFCFVLFSKVLRLYFFFLCGRTTLRTFF